MNKHPKLLALVLLLVPLALMANTTPSSAAAVADSYIVLDGTVVDDTDTTYVQSGHIIRIDAIAWNVDTPVDPSEAFVRIEGPVVGEFHLNPSAEGFSDNEYYGPIPDGEGAGNHSIWWTPAAVTDETEVTLHVNVTSESDFQYLNTTIMITNQPLDLSDSVLLPETTIVFTGQGLVLTAQVGSPVPDLDLAGINVFFDNNMTGTAGFSPASGISDASGQVGTLWTVPAAENNTVVNITATFSGTIGQEEYNSSVLVTIVDIDLSESTLVLAPDTVLGGHTATATVRAFGENGAVPGAIVTLTCDPEGLVEFDPPSGSQNTDANGYAVFTLTAPDVLTETIANISALVAMLPGDPIVLSENLTISPDLNTVVVQANATVVDKGDYVAFNVTVTHDSVPVVGADVTALVSESDGYFLPGELTTVSDVTDASGFVEFVWVANMTPFAVTGSNVLIGITVDDHSTPAVTTDLQVHVNPDESGCVMTVGVSATTIYPGESVAILIGATNNGIAQENETVEIVTTYGHFYSTNELDAMGQTDADGLAAFVWVCPNVTILEQFTVEITVEVNFIDESLTRDDTITITVVPHGATTSTGGTDSTTGSGDGDDSNFMDTLTEGNNLWIILGGAAAVALAGGSVVILRRK